MKVYMIVTADEYELPLAVLDTADQVARLLGRQRGDVYSAITRKTVSLDKFNGYTYRIVKVEIDDKEE